MPGSLSTNEKLRVISEFSELNPDGSVVFSGGETMLKTEEFFELSNKCRTLGLSCSCNTNGSFINNSNIERVLLEGPFGLTISLDSHLPSIHDRVRGIQGSYSHITNVIKQLLKIRDEKFSDSEVRVLTNSVIFEGNIKYLQEFIAFAEQLGLDGITFQMLSPTFMNMTKTDHFFKDHFFKDKEFAKACIRWVIDNLDRHAIVKTTKTDLEWMCLYIDNPDFITEQVCGSHEKNMMINSYGEVLLCFSMKEIANGDCLGNVREHTLKELWAGKKAAMIRPIMSQCRKNCGMLNCHRKTT